jgi:hypothetical protein
MSSNADNEWTSIENRLRNLHAQINREQTALLRQAAELKALSNPQQSTAASSTPATVGATTSANTKRAR